MMKFSTLSLCIIGLLADICYTLPAIETGPIKEFQKPNYRLTKDIEPLQYTIELTPYFEDEKPDKKQFTFDGSVQIDLIATRANVKKVVLHYEDMQILRKNIFKKPGSDLFMLFDTKVLSINDTKYDEVTKKYTIELTTALDVGKTYTLALKYTGKLQTDMNGFYRSSYFDRKENKTMWLASTHLEAVHARKVFPCFDEPQFKARFEIIMNRPKHFKPTISNMPLKTSWESIGTNRIKETFEKSPKMSTYLVAFIVSEFTCRQNSVGDFEVCSRPDTYNQTEYSFKVGQKLLANYDELFHYPYNTQLPKMTMAAIPDYVSGATENWGLLTYREASLLYQRKISTTMAKQKVATVVAHEQSHMWFGDLVTCKWWSDLWINEGFARFYQYFGTAMVEEEWGLEHQFVVDQVHNVFGIDSLEDTAPLSKNVNSPEEIAERFDSISYDKGASVLRMFQHAFGTKKFNEAIRDYLKTYSYRSAGPEQVFAAFQSVVEDKINVTELMSPWIFQPGYPVINVKLNDDRKSIKISQKRFLKDKKHHTDGTLYHVPITYATNNINSNFSNTNMVAVLSKEEMSISFDEPIDWVIVNVQQTGYYRVNYDDSLWSAISNALHANHSNIHVLNRAQIVDDTLNLARAGQLDYEKALQTVQYLSNEVDYAPWRAAFRNFDFILNRFELDDSGEFEKFILKLLYKTYGHLKFQKNENDTHLDIYNRVNILKYACRLRDEKCIEDARAEFENIKNGSKETQVDVESVVYCTVVAEGNDEEWNILWDRFVEANVASEKVTILNALGCAKKPSLIDKYLNAILSNEIRLQDKHTALVSTINFQQNLDIVLDFVIEKRKEIDEAFGSSNEIPKILSQIVERATAKEQIEKVHKFIKENNLESNDQLKRALKNSVLNMNWADENLPQIKSLAKRFVTDNAVTNNISYAVIFSSICLYLFQSSIF